VDASQFDQLLDVAVARQEVLTQVVGQVQEQLAAQHLVPMHIGDVFEFWAICNTHIYSERLAKPCSSWPYGGARKPQIKVSRKSIHSRRFFLYILTILQENSKNNCILGFYTNCVHTNTLLFADD
jgi:hypothetical protein